MTLASQLFSELNGRTLNHTDHDNQTIDIRYILDLILSGKVNSTNIYTGNVTPDPTQYSFWYDNSDGTFYFYDSSTASWIANSNATGPQGPQGPQGTQGPAGSNIAINIANGPSYSNDSLAAAGGITIGQFYRNGSQLMIRVS